MLFVAASTSDNRGANPLRTESTRSAHVTDAISSNYHGPIPAASDVNLELALII